MKNYCQSILLFLVLLSISSCGPIWLSLDSYTQYGEIDLKRPILTMDQYDERSATHARPYIINMDSAQVSYIVFGSEHTKDPNDSQLSTMKRMWTEFKPTVALVEARLSFLFRWFSDPTERFGESGFVYDLAKDDDIPTYTWEPPFEKEIAYMLKQFPQKRVALFYVLRPYLGQVRHSKPDDPDGFVEGTRGRRTKLPGLTHSLRDVAEIDSIWSADFQGLPDWRNSSDAYGWPGYLNDIAKVSNAFRDEHFIRVIIHLTRNGERVFAVCGSSHAVKIEEALKATLAE